MRMWRVSILAMALVGLALPGIAQAGPEQWASVKTTAVCSWDGATMTVEVGWVFVKEGNAIEPDISTETISLEQRVDRRWVNSGVLFDGVFDSNPHSHGFSLTPDEGATSLRATVVLTVDNANPRRGLEHTARCSAKT